MQFFQLQQKGEEALTTFVGQQTIKKDLRNLVDAALQSGESLMDLLICGPVGMGKTRLARSVDSDAKTLDRPNQRATVYARRGGNLLVTDSADESWKLIS